MQTKDMKTVEDSHSHISDSLAKAIGYTCILS